MFKSDKIFLFLLISVCLLISIVLIDSLMDPAILIKTVYARITGSPEPTIEGLYLPEIEESAPDLIRETTDSLIQDGWNLFRSEGFAFEIQFPEQVVKKSILNQDALNAGVGLNSEAPVWEFHLQDDDLYRETNLVDASLVIHVLEGADQEAACSTFLPGSIYQTPKQQLDAPIVTEINGVPFWKDEVLEGVMGEFYQRVSYRSFAKGACYQITQLLHYRNMDSLYDQEVTEFDQDRVMAELDQVLNTFSFLDVEPVFPEQTYPQPKALSTAVSKAASEYVDGLDVSHWQGTINWTKVANADYVFTFAKGTEGVGWTDVKFHENMTNGNDAGVMMGVYHFARPDLGNSAADEANHFLRESGDYLKSGYLRPVLDLEVGSSLGKTALSAWVIEWMETVENRTGISPIIYTNPNFIYNYLTNAVTEYDLWVAHWTCEPEPSYYYPNTGKWRDWAFWQYYGPGGCGGNAGYVPGIKTNIDLNIFNGVESGLQEYDAVSNLWVSLKSDAYYVPVPYYADITGNVNGDAAGLIDFAFWWDCTALEADLETVEGICGTLPAPAEGECEYNDAGMRCVAVENEEQLAEHTYTEIGNYTAKVIVERGGEPPAEDRYKISTYNPIRSTLLVPSSPSLAVIDYLYALDVDVTLHTILAGTLQVSLREEVSGNLVDSACIPVIADHESVESFELNWTESNPLEKNYEVWTRYRPLGECPIEDEHENDQVDYYQIYWMDEKAVLEIEDDAGTEIPAGGVSDLGETEPFEVIQQAYLVKNPSTMQGYQILSVSFENVVNAANLLMEPESPLTLDPEAEISLDLSFEVESSGPYSFDVILDHDASNSIPFIFSVQGTGVLSDNPIQSIAVQPPSPGSNWIGEDYDLHVDVDLAPPVLGTLQVSIEDLEGTPVADPICQAVPTTDQAVYGFDFSFLDENVGLGDYRIWARYRESGACPIVDVSPMDVGQGYQVDWQEDLPLLELARLDQSSIQADGMDDLGQTPLYQVIEVEYLIHNTSSTSDLEVSGITFPDAANITGPESLLTVPVLVSPGDEIPLVIRFEVLDPGEYSLEVELEHTASNPSPFGFTISGVGVIAENPVQSITPNPLSPGQALIGDDYALQIAAAVEAPVAGALQIQVLNSSGEPVQETFCQAFSEPGSELALYDLIWSESVPAVQAYDIAAAFFAREDCPPAGQPVGELTEVYQIEWVEEQPALEMTNAGGASIASGDTVYLGQFEYYQTVDLGYFLGNSSSTSPLDISSVGIENLVNIDGVEVDLDTPLTIDPLGNQDLGINFLVNTTGDFSFDLVLEHEGTNPSPFRVTFQGEGIMTDNPIQYVLPNPSSPGTSLIGVPFNLQVETGIQAPDQGALQVRLVDKTSGEEVDGICQTLVSDLDQPRNFNLVINQNSPGSRQYELAAGYRAQGECPITDELESDLRGDYTILWEEEIPTLAFASEDGTEILPGGADPIGDQPFYQEVTLRYTLANTSSTTALNIGDLAFENLSHVENVQVDPAGPFTVAPGGEDEISVTFLVAEMDNFSLDLTVPHDGSNTDPYTISILGTGVMDADPIKSLILTPDTPVEIYIDEEFALNVQAEIAPPAPGIVNVSLRKLDSTEIMGQTCFPILAEDSLLDVDLNWEEAIPGVMDYEVEVAYQALGECPFTGEPDGIAHESYQINWKTHQPALIVNRPEGVTIFDGAVDYIGVHDFFRFVEVTYLIENESNAGPLVISSILPENLENLREVIIEPAGEIKIQPGGSQEIVISFQVLTLEPYSFDLVWEHNGSNPAPYITGIMGDSNLNLGDAPADSWLYRFLESLIQSGFFLKLPILGLFMIRRKKRLK